MDESCLVPSFPWMSVEEAGVGGNAVRGMIIDSESGGCLFRAYGADSVFCFCFVRTVMKARYQRLGGSSAIL